MIVRSPASRCCGFLRKTPLGHNYFIFSNPIHLVFPLMAAEVSLPTCSIQLWESWCLYNLLISQPCITYNFQALPLFLREIIVAVTWSSLAWPEKILYLSVLSDLSPAVIILRFTHLESLSYLKRSCKTQQYWRLKTKHKLNETMGVFLHFPADLRKEAGEKNV